MTGPDVDKARLDSYLAAATERAAELDGEIIVFGSGGARHVPEGFSRTRAHDQILEFLEAAANYAGEHGLVIAIEHLNRSETNVITSIAEAVKTLLMNLVNQKCKYSLTFITRCLRAKRLMKSSVRESGLCMYMSQTPIGSIRAAADTIISFLPEALLMPDTTNGSL